MRPIDRLGSILLIALLALSVFVGAAAAQDEATKAEEAPTATADPAPPKSGPTLSVYGFAQLDAIYDFQRSNPDWDATLRPSTIPVTCDGTADSDDGCGRNTGNMTFSVRQSRFGVKGHVPTEYGDFNTQFEFDLFGVGGDAGQTTFRLRHAYGELGQVGAGQTWSLFMDPDVFPNTMDYWGPTGMIFLRNPQLRWTPIRSEEWSVAVALEAPGSAVDEGKLRITAPELDASAWNSYPDFTAQVRRSGSWGHVQVSGILRAVGFQVDDQPGRNSSGHELGGGVNVASTLNVFEKDTINLQFAGGSGIANYLNDGGTDIAPDDSTPTGVRRATTVPLVSWLAYYNRTWSEKFTSSIGYSEVRQFTVGGQSDVAYDMGQYANVNVLFHPISGMTIGPEYIWGRLNLKGGADETDNRLQLSVKYVFGITVRPPS
jgi:hypothetical protein